MALHLAAGLAERGNPVDLVMFRREGAYADIVPDNVRAIELGANRAAASIPRLKRYFEEERPASVLSMALPMSFACTIAAGFAHWKPRLVWSIRSATSHALKDMPWAARVSFPLAARILCSRAASLAAVSNGVAMDFAKMVKIAPEKVTTIYNPAKPMAPSFHRQSNSADAKVIMAMGRLRPQKNFPLLIKAFADVRRQVRSRLVIYGDGPLRPELEALVESEGLSSDVSLPGFTNDASNEISRADAFVLSSNWEGLPNVLLEALAAGTPVVATDCPHGPREILQGGRWGELVPCDDKDALAAAITRVLVNGGIDGRARAEDFNSATFIEKYAELLESPR